MLLEYEIAEEYEVAGKQIKTPYGWCDIKKVYKTIPLQVWELHTAHHKLEASGHHLVLTPTGCKEIQSLFPGDIIFTETGLETIFYIAPSKRVEPLYDITIDDERGLFYSQGVVSHNSTTFCARQLIYSHLIPRMYSLYIAPYEHQVSTYGDRMEQMQAMFSMPAGKQNKYSKKFENGSSIRMISCLTTADKARGISADEVLFDECCDACTKVFVQIDKKNIDKPTSICDISVGAKIAGFDENDEHTYVTVTAKQCKGYRPCYRIRTATGKELVCTGNHRIRTDQGWRYTIELAGSLQRQHKDSLFGEAHRTGGFVGFTAHEGAIAGVVTGGHEHCSEPEDKNRRGTNTMQPWNKAKDLCSAESRFVSTTLYPVPAYGQSGLWGSTGSYSDTVTYSIEPSKEVLLLKSEPRIGENTEIRHSGMGGPIDMGSYCMVDFRRWFLKQDGTQLHNIYTFFFGGRSGSPGELVSYSWSHGSEAHYGEEERETISYDIDGCRSFILCGSSYSTIYPDLYGLQSGNAGFIVQGDMPTLPGRACSYSPKVYGEVEERLLGVREERMPAQTSCDSQQEVLRFFAYRGKETTLDSECKYRECEGFSQEVGGEEQGEDFRAETPEICCDQGRHSCGEEKNSQVNLPGRIDYKALFLLWRGNADKPSSTESGSAIEDWEARMFFKGMCECAQLPCKVLIQTEEGRTGWDTIVSIEYAGDQEVWDITTDPHHTFFADGIGTHNCQGMDPEIVPEILYTKTMSELPTVVYSGTALSVDTLLEANWIDSSMGMWHVRAGDGTTWLNMYDKDTLFKVCDNPQGPTCPITGKLLKVTDGCFVHAKKGNLNSGRVGVHIPQCIIPDIAYNAQRWGEVYQKIQRDDPKKVMQECFGIAVSEGSREISERDLMRLCVLTDTEEQLKKKCHNGYYKKVISGCDWGGSDYNPALKTKTSYTVHCIIGISPSGTIDILHYRRYAGMMYDEIARTIIAEHKAYNGYAIASDFGVGLAYNMEIRKHIPFDRHFIMSYVGPTTAPVATPAGAHMQNQLSINRTEALTNVFRDVKRFDPQRIRCRNWGDMQPFLSDWLNMFRVPVEMPGGQNVFKYVRAATKADDALHAFTFAYVIAKIYRGDSLVKDPALEKRIRTVLGAATIGQKEAAVRQELFGMPNYVVSG